MTRLLFRRRAGASVRLPTGESALVRLLAQVGMTVEDIEPPSKGRRHMPNYPDCWSIELTDPIHNFAGSSFYFHRYVEQAGLTLYDFVSRPGARAARVALIVGKPRPHEE